MNFSVGITVLRQYDLLMECVAAVKMSTLVPEAIYIADNGCSLGSVDGCVVMNPGKNLGCAGGWNLLVRAIHPTAAIILNDDTIVAPDTFTKMMGISSPSVVLGHGFSCFRIDHEITKAVGSFDEEFWPAYYEDADFHVRMLSEGMTPVDLSSIVTSHGNHDHAKRPYQGLDAKQKAEFDLQVKQNEKRFALKWGGPPSDFLPK